MAENKANRVDFRAVLADVERVVDNFADGTRIPTHASTTINTALIRYAPSFVRGSRRLGVAYTFLDVADALHTTTKDTRPAAALALDILELKEQGAISAAVFERLMSGLTMFALQNLTRTLKKELQAKKEEQREIEAEQNF